MYKAILSSEPGFVPYCSDNEDNLPGAFLSKNPSHQVYFTNAEGWQGWFSCDRTIVRQSHIIPYNREHVQNCLGFSSQNHHLKGALIYCVTLAEGQDATSSPNAICQLFTDGNFGSGTCGVAIYLDLPPKFSADWFSQFEEQVLQIFPNVEFENHAGSCADCLKPLEFKEYKRRDGFWDSDFLCEACYYTRKTLQDFWLKQEAAQKKLLAKLGFNKVKAAVVCSWCQKVILRSPETIPDYPTQLFCNRDCMSEYKKFLAQSSRVKIKCCRCGKNIFRTKKSILRHISLFCSDFCRTLYLSETGMDKMIYTPDLLVAMAKAVGEQCAFPGCQQLKAPYSPLTNRWNACKVHALRIYAALRERRAVKLS